MIIVLSLMTALAALFFVAWRMEIREHRKSLNLAMEMQDEAYTEYWALVKKCDEKDEHIRAIEQGRDEETECYEAQYLSFEDITKSMTAQINDLKSELGAYRIRDELHRMYCLPNLKEIDRTLIDLEWAIERMDDTPVFNSVASYML